MTVKTRLAEACAAVKTAWFRGMESLCCATMKIAFIGLGRMGMGMARNLLRAGHTVAVFNRSREKADALAGSGARVANSPANACVDAEVIMTMVADDYAVEQIVFGNDGIASAMKKDSIHVSHSTISTALARRLTAEHAERKQGYLSVPVFGRPEHAESKNLVVVAAGSERTRGSLPSAF